MAAPTPIKLSKLVLLAAWPAGDPTATEAGLEALGDQLADQLRAKGALTVASEYDLAHAAVPPAGGDDADEVDDDAAGEALAAYFPPDTVPVGPLPPVRALGYNGLYRKARLVRTGDRIELWLGTPKERYPLASWPAPAGS